MLKIEKISPIPQHCDQDISGKAPAIRLDGPCFANASFLSWWQHDPRKPHRPWGARGGDIPAWKTLSNSEPGISKTLWGALKQFERFI